MKKLNSSGRSIQTEDTAAGKLYKALCVKKYTQYPYNKQNIGEKMCLINVAFGEYWKPRYLVDEKNKTAVEFMNGCATLQTVCANDIDWKSLEGLPPGIIFKAKQMDAIFPTRIVSYKHGVSEVSWQLNPDGMYYMDEDGFGMTNDEEITIYSYIDRAGKPLVKFRYIKNFNELDKMREEAIMRTKHDMNDQEIQ